MISRQVNELDVISPFFNLFSHTRENSLRYVSSLEAHFKHEIIKK